MSKPICFMIMPFSKKKTYSSVEGFPKEIDFDALWNKAYFPALSKTYDPIRADQDLGALIIKEMIERLVISDLVIADVTIPNANVYYELGIRHAAKRNMSVMTAAEGSKQLFDIEQMPQLRYPLKEGNITDETAAGIIAVIESGLDQMKNGVSPVYQSVTGYPDDIKVDAAESFKEFSKTLFDFQARVREVEFLEEPKEALKKLIDDYDNLAQANMGVAMEILYLVRDKGAWNDVINFINQMNPPFRENTKVQEIKYLAQAKGGSEKEVIQALTGLETLVKDQGATSERHGLIGGRYSTLLRAATNERNKIRYLDKAIEHYQKGMDLDLNEYYPSCNLPRLYRLRKKRGDEDLAEEAAISAKLACRRMERVNPEDPWLYPTLIGTAFDEGDVDNAYELLDEIKRGDLVKWKIDSTIDTAKMSIDLHDNEAIKNELLKILDEMKALIEQ